MRRQETTTEPEKGFAALPHYIAADLRLSGDEIRVLLALLFFARDKADCRPTLKQIAERCGAGNTIKGVLSGRKSDRAIQLALKNLAKHKFIRIETDQSVRSRRWIVLVWREGKNAPHSRKRISNKAGSNPTATPKKTSPYPEENFTLKGAENCALTPKFFAPPLSKNQEREKQDFIIDHEKDRPTDKGGFLDLKKLRPFKPDPREVERIRRFAEGILGEQMTGGMMAKRVRDFAGKWPIDWFEGALTVAKPYAGDRARFWTRVLDVLYGWESEGEMNLETFAYERESDD